MNNFGENIEVNKVLVGDDEIITTKSTLTCKKTECGWSQPCQTGVVCGRTANKECHKRSEWCAGMGEKYENFLEVIPIEKRYWIK
ncbi:MAG: hypothetical protein K2N15_10970 [Lachnospiraceae bacterium]|nr:hypothetical protein [Lachnospiraceae bacterium]